MNSKGFVILYSRKVFVLLYLIVLSSCSKEGNREHNDDGRFKGKYTRDITDYELLVPRKINEDGTFASFSLPHFYERDSIDARDRKRRDADTADDKLHYAVQFNGETHHLELVPNPNFMSPGLVIESRVPHDVKRTRLRQVTGPQCHYTGWVRGKDGSRAAVSVCDGLVGYIKTSAGHFFIEPALHAEPKQDGRHLHLVHRNSKDGDGDGKSEVKNCAVSDDWQKAWSEGFRSQFNSGVRDVGGRHSKQAAGKERYIESLVVADRKFLQFHNDTDVENYILTIMNMVSDYYHDDSIGNLIEFVLVRIIFLEKENEEIDLEISPNAEKTLDSFCEWQHRVNPPDHKHPNHHDVAVLLTRYDICADNVTSCGLLGLAYVATACAPSRGCSINEDTGLTLSVVVAHEVGHNMGCPHDVLSETGCDRWADDNSSYVMSPVVKFHTTRWSPCSQRFISEFISNGLGECLLDEPQDQNFKVVDMPAGAMYDADYQCEVSFGDGIGACQTGTDTFCNQLWCQTSAHACSSYGDPAADGTKCGNNMWCYDEKCVEIGERPGAVDGEWGEWGPWSECSRTCGGGVSYQERECDKPPPQNRGRYCQGKRKHYQTCNTATCPVDSVPYRDSQCAEFNKKKYQNVTHTWTPFKPKQGAINPCSLICVNEARVYSELRSRVYDGTPCKPGTKHLCVAGECTKVGCDWVIDSDAMDDQCGLCRGDGTQCTLVEGVYNSTSGKGYVNVTTIPKGVRNIQIEELAPTQNTMAISSTPSADKPDVKFYLNGEFHEDDDGEVKFGTNTVGLYSHPEPEREECEISGPTSEELTLYSVFYGPGNPGLWYKYFVASANSSYLPRYSWEFLEWDDCSARCGGGSEIAVPCCVEVHAGRVSDSFCHPTDKPQDKSRVCNTRPCNTRWKVGTWSACRSGSTGQGIQHRKVTCVRESPHPDEQDVEERPDKCKEQKPKHSRTCSLPKKSRSPSPEAGAKSNKPVAKSHSVPLFLDNAGSDPARVGLSRPGDTHSNIYNKRPVVPYEPQNKVKTGERKIQYVHPSYKYLYSDKKANEMPGVKPGSSKLLTVPDRVARKDEKDDEDDEADSEDDLESGRSCSEAPKVKANACAPAKDRVEPDEIVVYEAPIAAVKVKPRKECDRPRLPTSDQANAELGDKVPAVSLDICHEKVLRGEAAAAQMKQIRHPKKDSCGGTGAKGKANFNTPQL